MSKQRKGMPNVKISITPPPFPKEIMDSINTFLACMDILTGEYDASLGKDYKKITTAHGEFRANGEVIQIQISLAKKPAHMSKEGVVFE